LLIKGKSCRAKDIAKFLEDRYGAEFHRNFYFKTNKANDKGAELISVQSGITIIKDGKGKKCKSHYYLAQELTDPKLDMEALLKRVESKRGELFDIKPGIPDRRKKEIKKRLRKIEDALRTIQEFSWGKTLILKWDPKNCKLEEGVEYDIERGGIYFRNLSGVQRVVGQNCLE
jgi:hypothetical protein